MKVPRRRCVRNLLSKWSGLDLARKSKSDVPGHVGRRLPPYFVFENLREGLFEPVTGVGLNNAPDCLGLIRFGGHLSKGEYDVQTDGRHTEAGAPPVHR
jgi:hypothetical protein